jgi:nucleoside-diphosphate-sugar epimerase
MVELISSRLFCFGLGYTALALANALAARGFRVAGTTRTIEKAERLAGLGIEVSIFDGTVALDTEALAGVTHLLVSVPPDTDGDVVLRHSRAALARLAIGEPPLRWVGVLSTTGVYGDRGGDWVDEGSDLEPTSARTRRRAEAERQWLELREQAGVPVHIFRLAGIYGPGRSMLDQLRAGSAKRIIAPGHLFSRIHIADIVAVLAASIDAPNPGAIYNLCDDEPAPPAEVTDFAAGLLGLPSPPARRLEDADLSAMARSFWADNKRVRNTRIKEELGVTLKYPNYRAGLAALAADEGGPDSPP